MAFQKQRMLALYRAFNISSRMEGCIISSFPSALLMAEGSIDMAHAYIDIHWYLLYSYIRFFAPLMIFFFHNHWERYRATGL